MEPMLFLGNASLLPMILLPKSSSMSSQPKKTKLHFSLSNHIFPSINSIGGITRPSLRNASGLAIRALDECSSPSSVPSRNDRNSNKIARKAARASVALACVLGIIGAGLKMNGKAIAGPREKFQKAPQITVAPSYPLGGQYALNSLLEVSAYLSSSKREPMRPPSRIPARPSKEDVYELKKDAMRLMQHGRPEDAVMLLQKAYKACESDSEPAYNVGMTLVEILISQGKYTDALQYCNSFKDERLLPSDGRILLYKAVVHTMLDHREEAKKWWEKYVETVDENPFD